MGQAEGAGNIRVCVVGATGFAGVEACRFIVGHPQMELAMATDRKLVGTPLTEVYPALLGLTDITFTLPEPQAIAACSDVALLAVPHTASLALTPALLAAGVSVIDLSADYRLRNAQIYEHWYNTPHTSPELLDSCVYGLPELNRAALATLASKRAGGEAVLVAAPGCYPTATALAAAPALEAGLAIGDLVISDAISGVSGAGRKPTARVHYCHADESVEPYSVAGHRHTPEMEQTLTQVAGRLISVVFTPHLAPYKRGILATVYLKAANGVTAEQVQACYEQRYAQEPFVSVLPAGKMPATASVAGSNRAQIGIALDSRAGMIIACSVIDNLCKGAAGQAVQCANIICGLPETAGLSAPMPVV